MLYFFLLVFYGFMKQTSSVCEKEIKLSPGKKKKVKSIQ